MSWSSDSSRIPPEQQIRNSLIRSLDANGATPSTFLDLLDAVTQPPDEDSPWRKLQDRHGCTFQQFIDFVTAERPEGLGLHGKDDLTKHLTLQHKEEREPYRRADTVKRMVAMRRRVEELLFREIPEALPWERPTTDSNKDGGTNYTPLSNHANTVTHVVARLKRDADDDPKAAELLGEILSGETKPNAAAREMGWRKPRIVLSNPERIAKSLRRHMPREALLRIAELLTKED